MAGRALKGSLSAHGDGPACERGMHVIAGPPGHWEDDQCEADMPRLGGPDPTLAEAYGTALRRHANGVSRRLHHSLRGASQHDRQGFACEFASLWIAAIGRGVLASLG